MANRKHGIIDGLDPVLRAAVENMLLEGSTYGDIIDYLKQHDVAISMASVCRYAKQYNANLATLQIAQENFRRLMDEMDRYPDLDTTEAILRIASQRVLQAVSDADDEKWADMDIDKLMSSALGLARAAAYKRRTDAAVREESDVGLDAVKDVVFAAMAKDRPDLYKQVAGYLNKKKKDGSLKAPKVKKS